mgnify:CR=1 FL=1
MLSDQYGGHINKTEANILVYAVSVYVLRFQVVKHVNQRSNPTPKATYDDCTQ